MNRSAVLLRPFGRNRRRMLFVACHLTIGVIRAVGALPAQDKAPGATQGSVGKPEQP